MAIGQTCKGLRTEQTFFATHAKQCRSHLLTPISKQPDNHQLGSDCQTPSLHVLRAVPDPARNAHARQNYSQIIVTLSQFFESQPELCHPRLLRKDCKAREFVYICLIMLVNLLGYAL